MRPQEASSAHTNLTGPQHTYHVPRLNPLSIVFQLLLEPPRRQLFFPPRFTDEVKA